MTPKERAEASAKALWAADRASSWLGMELIEVDEGRAIVEMTVQEHHCNGHKTCHGGITFALADSAFAFAGNSRNKNAVAQHNVITYIAPARMGDRLRAEAREISLVGRNGVYDICVTNQEGRAVAEFRGMSRVIQGHLFEE